MPILFSCFSSQNFQNFISNGEYIRDHSFILQIVMYLKQDIPCGNFIISLFNWLILASGCKICSYIYEYLIIHLLITCTTDFL